MSGCHVVATEVCMHGKIRGFCEFCVIEDLQAKCRELTNRAESFHEFKLSQIDATVIISKKLDLLKDQLINDQEVYIHLIERVDRLESENKMRQDTIACLDQAYDKACRQIDERLMRIEQLNQQCFEANPIKNIEDKFKDIDSAFYRIELSRQCDLRSNEELFDRIKELERFQEIIHLEYKNKNQPNKERFEKIESKIACLMQKSNLNDEKRPFKCPVCSGNGIVSTPDTVRFDILIAKQSHYGSSSCTSCNGKGIIWG